LRLFILRRFFGSPTRHRANANTNILSAIFALRYAQPAKSYLNGMAAALRRPDGAGGTCST